MPIQIQEINDGNEAMECPLCMEPFEVDDINFFPCACGYQICRFCWHRIRTDENGLCPACRTSYPENPAEFRPLSGSDLQKIRQEKRQKEVQRRQKLTDGRRHLAAIRVLQKNLVFVVGLSQRLSDPEILKRQDYFGKYGRIIKVVINSNTAYAGAQGPSCSAYVTYSKMEEALRAIQSVNNVYIDGRTLKASLGTTKYCSTYLKNQQCHKPDCMYLHELAEMESSFTKEDMQAGKHQELEQRLIEQLIQKEVEVAARVDSVYSSDTGATSDTERSTTRPRHNSGSSSGPVQQIRKVENSWLTGSGELGLSSRLSSSLEEKQRKSTDPVSMKTVTTSQHKDLLPSHEDDTVKTDSGGVSSECSSTAITPPPVVMSCDADTIPPENSNNITTTTVSPQPSNTTDLPATEPENHVVTPNNEETTEYNEESELSRATEVLCISKPEEPSNQYKPFQRFNQLDEEFTSLPMEYARGHLIQGSTWIDNGEDKKLQEAIPISSSNDWEVAFGFGKPPSLPSFSPSSAVVETGDDDLGFDPFTECKKGLADLIEKEAVHDPLANRGWSNTALPSRSMMSQPLPSAFPSRRQQPTSMGNQMPSLQFGSKPSSGFSSGFSSNSSMDIGFSSPPNQLHRNGNFSSNINLKGNHVDSPHRNGLNEWQNGLRALLPSVNINFAMDNNSAGGPVSNQGSHNVPGFGRPPPNHNLTRTRPTYSMGYEGRSVPGLSGPTLPQQSALFPNRTQPSLFHNGFGLGQSASDRYSPIAPPPGLGSTSFHSDPAIISSGNKPFAHMPSLPTPVEETPHWMKSLQTLTDTDSSMNPAPSSGFMPITQQNTAPFSSWPNLTNPGIGSMGGSQPPPGFQSRLPYTNNSDLGIRHSLLENQS